MKTEKQTKAELRARCLKIIRTLKLRVKPAKTYKPNHNLNP